MKIRLIAALILTFYQVDAQQLVPNGTFENLSNFQWQSFGQNQFVICNDATAITDAQHVPCQGFSESYSCASPFPATLTKDFSSCQDPIGAGNETYCILTSDQWGLRTTGMNIDLGSPLLCGVTYNIKFRMSRFDQDDGGSIGIQIGLADLSNWTGTWDGRTNIDDLEQTHWCTNKTDWDWVDFDFQVPCDRCSLNGLLIWANVPATGVGLCFAPYGRIMYIDNIELTEISTQCSSTLSTLNPGFTGFHTDTEPFTIYNLENVSYLDLHIYYNNQLKEHIGPLLNPPSEVCWDGKDNNGNEFPSASYSYTLDLHNGCGPYESYSGVFPKVTDIGTYSKICMCNESVSKPDLLCCSSNITLTNETIKWDPTTPSPLIYASTNSITIGQNVSIPKYTCMDAFNHVEMYAGGYFDFDGAALDPYSVIEIELGADVTFSLDPCPLRITNPDSNSNLSSEASSKMDSTFNIMPNPASTQFVISTEFKETFELTSYELSGRIIYHAEFSSIKTINTQNWSKGFYIVMVRNQSGRIVHHKKLIIQ